jgi:hypothetical protein
MEVEVHIRGMQISGQKRILFQKTKAIHNETRSYPRKKNSKKFIKTIFLNDEVFFKFQKNFSSKIRAGWEQKDGTAKKKTSPINE